MAKETNTGRFEVVEVATQTERMFQDTDTKETFSLEEAVKKLLNVVHEINSKL